MPLEQIARILFNMSLDMDYADNLEHAEKEIACLKKELLVLNDNGCNSLLQALEIIAMKNKNMEFWKEKQETIVSELEIIEFDIECFDRILKIETFKDNVEKTRKIMRDSYDLWVENPDNIVGDMCCEEYIINELEENLIVFREIK